MPTPLQEVVRLHETSILTNKARNGGGLSCAGRSHEPYGHSERNSMEAAPAIADQVPIQQRADQIMAGIQEAHEIVDGILGQPDAQGYTAPAGAEQQLDRCREGLNSLTTRLQELSRRTGKL